MPGFTFLGALASGVVYYFCMSEYLWIELLLALLISTNRNNVSAWLYPICLYKRPLSAGRSNQDIS
ncbi:hypothetical protein D3C86_2020780 [compost metagenome]